MPATELAALLAYATAMAFVPAATAVWMSMS
jgi:hypothetical protein